ncbi:adenosylcobinamide kinase/adenosylcobinamide phosphate guanyltransferase [Streptococcus danieliae]|uniref:Adenosylcobinamide kinase n=1 Tax=Streptococcus danieliae TaxID=747656 RepID=A0A7X3G6N3_9STRE|nr:bifunctional adenosylcobinamide kinase/adenosylcobinamide-phosphate guanylyltransferase [Streptococcus danieliae]MVX58081.1 adenosylcobinamide kinase/adenosylcobinamide phosphate guanyltransferase [Streptococcus danieliae]
MGKLVLVLGGIRSGKSKFAEQELLAQSVPVCYLATGLLLSPDEEWNQRVEAHRNRRPAHWGTHEGYQNLAEVIYQRSEQLFLLDSATMLTSNLLFDFLQEKEVEQLSPSTKEELELRLEREWSTILKASSTASQELWIVSDEVGLGLQASTYLGRLFQDIQGKRNQQLAREADEVYWVVSGLVQRLK